MKRIKSFMLCIMTVMTFCLLLSNVLTVSAATEKKEGEVYVEAYYDVKGNVQNTKKMRIGTMDMYSFEVEYGKGDKITNLKVKKKGGMTAKVTYSREYAYSDYGYSDISMYATKAGTYTVSFDVVDSQNKKLKSCSVKVQAVNSWEPIKKAVFGKKTVKTNTGSIKKGTLKTSSKTATKVSGKSGKIKVTPNSQYKITGLVVVAVDKNGKYTYKKIKNGKNITLSKTYENVYRYASDDGYSSRSAKKYTYIYVSYKDKFFGDTRTYSISKARGRKEVKCVEKNKVTGRKTTSYSRCPSADITLWQY